MRRAVAAVGLIVVVSCPTFGQSPETTATFAVADLHVRPPSRNPNPFMTGGVLRASRYDLRNATMLDFITTAYEVDRDTVLGGPSWLESKRYDLIAKAPAS